MNIGKRHINKTYIKIPFGEIQYGHLTGRIDVWFRGKLYKIKKSTKGLHEHRP